MSDETQNITLTDADGQDHRYGCRLHPAGEGFRLMNDLAAIVGGTLGKLLSGAAQGEPGGEELGDDVDLGSAIGMIPRLISLKGEDKLLRRILRYTSREDTPDANGRPIMQKLKSDRDFDQAYAGNYGEMFDAVGWVLKVNYGPFFEGIGSRLSGLLASASELLPKQPEPPESPAPSP